MSVPYELKLVNGIGGDPAVWCFLPNLGQAILFDLGSIENLTAKEIHKIQTVLISHCHIDHFIGFDRLLRCHIVHKHRLHFIGPIGLADNIRNKLNGYTWNLLDPDQIVFDITEIDSTGIVRCFSVSNTDNFACHKKSETSPPITDSGHVVKKNQNIVATVASFEDGSHIQAVVLDHKTASISYRYTKSSKKKVKQQKLIELGINPGRWIHRLIEGDYKSGEHYCVGSEKFLFSDLAETILETAPDWSVGYYTDAGFTDLNINSIRSLMESVNILIAECSFKDNDKIRAAKKSHLTVRQTAMIAAIANVDDLMPFHVSGLYGSNQQEVVEEAKHLFNLYQSKQKPEIELEIEVELKAIAKLL